MKAWALGVGAALLLGACATPAPTPASFATAHSEQALVRWKKGAQSLVCEAVFSRATDDAVRAQLYKGSPKALLLLTLEHSGRLAAHGTLAGGGWSGVASTAPLPLSTWAAMMQIYQIANAWPDGEREIHSGNTRALLTMAYHQLRTLTLINDLSGEVITANFSSSTPKGN